MTVGVLPYETLKENALALTAWFETTDQGLPMPRAYGVTSGNHDGQGLSWGALQFNLGQGTVQPIWKDLYEGYPSVVLTAFENDTARRDEWVDMLYNMTTSEQVAWGDKYSVRNTTDPNMDKRLFQEPWNTYFMNLGVTQQSIDRQKQSAQWYYDQAETWKPLLKVWSRQGYALLFDIAVQKGSFPQGCIDQCIADYDALDTTGMSIDEIEHQHLLIIANRRTDYGDISSVAIDAFRQRKTAIANGSGTVYGSSFSVEPYDMILEPAYESDIEASGEAVSNKIMIGANNLDNVLLGIVQVNSIMMGANLMWRYIEVPKYRYVKLRVNGSANTDWNPTEWKVILNGTNIALGKTVTTTASTFAGTLSALTDGATAGAVYLNADETKEQNTFTLDLGTAQAIDSIEMDYAYATAYSEMIVSEDGVTWYQASLQTGDGTAVHTYAPTQIVASDLLPDPIAPTPSGWQYVKYQGFGDNTNGATTRLVELTALEGSTNHMLGLTPINAYEAINFGGAITKVTDGVVSYVSGEYCGWWTASGVPTLVYDLGSAKPLTDLEVYMYTNPSAGDGRQTKFKLWVSNDNVNWTLVADYSNNTTVQPTTGFKFTAPTA